jgi:hypothetical protein
MLVITTVYSLDSGTYIAYYEYWQLLKEALCISIEVIVL